MIRLPRATEAHSEMITLGRALQPIPVYPWSNAALSYLGVPTFVAHILVVVADENMGQSVQKLQQAGFHLSRPNRNLYPTIIQAHPNPEQSLARIYAHWAPLDQVSKVFDYLEWKQQLWVIPNSFACIPDQAMYVDMQIEHEFDIYNNIRYPLERTLIESFIRCVLDDTSPSHNRWRCHLLESISLMYRYLDVENDILDTCADPKVVDWFGQKYGRDHEAKNGPHDLRVSKRLGSGKELPVNSRGKLLSPEEATSPRLSSQGDAHFV